MLERLKAQVFCSSLELSHYHLTIQNYGSVSGIDRQSGLVVVKPAGVSFRDMQISDMVVVDFSGRVVDGYRTPSVDILAHLELYKEFPKAGSVVHSRSRWATIFAQIGRALPPFNTLHSNHFLGEIPCTRRLTQNEIEAGFQVEIGQSIVQLFKDRDPERTPAALVQNHGAYTWGIDPAQGVRHAQLLEECAMMAWHSLAISGGSCPPMQPQLQEWYKSQPRD